MQFPRDDDWSIHTVVFLRIFVDFVVLFLVKVIYVDTILILVRFFLHQQRATASLDCIKSPQVSMTFLCIPADPRNVVDWMVSILPPISSVPILWRPFQGHQPQLVSPSSIYSTFFLFFSKVQVFISLFAFFYFHTVVRRNGKIYLSSSLFLKVLTQDLVFWLEFGDSFVPQNHREIHAYYNFYWVFSSTLSGVWVIVSLLMC